MQVLTTEIEGLLIIHPRVFGDERGYFFESYNEKGYRDQGIHHHFVQDNESVSALHVLRGLHFQAPPYDQGKLVRVIKGKVLDVAVDIRKSSPTYGKHFSIELSGENKIQFWIPPGFAHGFLTLEDQTVFSYKCTNLYHKESEGAIHWNDPGLDIKWNIQQPIVSEKDNLALTFKELNSPF